MGKKFYAVAKGRQIGIYKTWPECKAQVDGFKFPKYKGFETMDEAQDYIDEHSDHRQNKVAKASISQKMDITQELKALRAFNEAIKTDLSEFVSKMSNKIEENNAKIDAIINSSVKGKRGLEATVKEEFEEEVERGPPGKRPRNSGDEAGMTEPNENGFHRDDEGFVTVYTDGSCENNGRPNARAGYGVWWADHHPLNKGEAASKPTNNAAEIEAATQAVRLAKDNHVTKLKILTDSKFLIQCVKDWMPGWKRNNWRTAKNEPVKNRLELEELDQALNSGKILVTWQHVRGHAGVHGNEQADALARLGSQEYARKHKL